MNDKKIRQKLLDETEVGKVVVYAAKDQKCLDSIIKDFQCSGNNEVDRSTKQVPITTIVPITIPPTTTSTTTTTTTTTACAEPRITPPSYQQPTLTNLQDRLPDGSRVHIFILYVLYISQILKPLVASCQYNIPIL